MFIDSLIKKKLVNPQDNAHTHLYGPMLSLARGAWIVIAVLICGAFLAILPIRYHAHYTDSIVIPRRWINIHINYQTGRTADSIGIESDFTPALKEIGPISGDLIYAGTGCNADGLRNTNLRNKIVLLDRGGCIFLEKVQNAEKAGAAAVLVANDQTGPLGNMVAASTANIPAVLLQKETGDLLKRNTPAKIATITLSFAFVNPSPAAQLGISRELYAGYRLALNLAVFFSALVMSLFIFWRRSEDWLALLVALAFLAIAASPISSWDIRADDFLYRLSPIGRFTAQVIAIIADLSVYIAVFLLFPNGHFAPRWMWIIAVLSVPWVILRQIFPGPPPRLGGPAVPLLSLLIVLAFYAIALCSQVYRYRYISTPAQREQTRWVLFGLTVAVFGNIFPVILLFIYPNLDSLSASNVHYSLISPSVGTLSMIFALLMFAIAILHYRLWDIDILINRTLVYGGLTVIVIGIYVLIVGSLGTMIQGKGNILISILATGLVAILIQPLRDRLQRAVNRMMYGDRDDPVSVLSRLAHRLGNTLAPDAVLPSLVETVGQTLKLPYVAIETPARSTSISISSPVFAYGQPTSEIMQLPLVYQSEAIGQLLISPRSPGEALSPMDRHLLQNIAHQAAMAVHAVSLTFDLQRSRQQLVSMREEERRLRRDLHDGLGPNLASQGLKLAAVKQLLDKDLEAAIPLLDQVMLQNQTTVEDVRRLVYDLRPPALDELGLLAAIRDYVAGMDSSVFLQVECIGPNGGLPPLSAAVEVAAYRIVLEAITNVVRHAQAKHCRIQFSVAQSDLHSILGIEIQDDGVGLPENYRAGIGTRSIRERAEELGGTCEIVSRLGSGTRICVRIPIEGPVITQEEPL